MNYRVCFGGPNFISLIYEYILALVLSYFDYCALYYIDKTIYTNYIGRSILTSLLLENFTVHSGILSIPGKL